MRGWLPLVVVLVIAGSAVAAGEPGDAVSVLQETRTREPGKKTVQHVALLKNTSTRPVRGLRVTVELYDFFGKLLWARTVSPAPSSLRPGDTATLSVATPDLPAYRQTRYRFDYRGR
jgi:hypothetical protein